MKSLISCSHQHHAVLQQFRRCPAGPPERGLVRCSSSTSACSGGERPQWPKGKEDMPSVVPGVNIQ